MIVTFLILIQERENRITLLTTGTFYFKK